MNFNSPPVSVIYLNDAKERYNLNYDEAISRCVGINTQIATLQLLRDNYNLGWDTCTCCWVDLSVELVKSTTWFRKAEMDVQ